MASKEKTTLYLDGAEYRRLKALARTQNRSVAELVREAVAEYAARHAAPTMPQSLGSGHSGSGDLSERAEEFLGGMGEDR
ncbi:MAG: ribbon-helix-helix domain-containing protein [Gemmatimonadota bacterium]|nr:ribbon-helix-helix domain-containing protein [Gemmatimonadota bacterium]